MCESHSRKADFLCAILQSTGNFILWHESCIHIKDGFHLYIPHVVEITGIHWQRMKAK